MAERVPMQRFRAGRAEHPSAAVESVGEEQSHSQAGRETPGSPDGSVGCFGSRSLT